MPVVLPDRPSRQLRSSSEIGTSLGERLGAQFEQAMEDNPVPLFVRWDELAKAQKVGRYMPQEEARAAAERAGAVIDIPAAGVTAPALDIMIERALKRHARQQVIDAAPQGVLPTAAGIGVGIGAGFLDPIGLGLNFVPVVRETSRLGMAANSARLGTRLAARTGVGLIEGAVGQAMVEPFTGYVYRQEGQQYGLRDAAQNLAMGGLLGASAHNVFGAAGDLYRGLTGKAQPWAMPGTEPISPEVAAAAESRVPSGGAEASGAIMGRRDRVKVNNRYEDVRWALVDADEVAVAMEKGEGQFRDRTRAASEQQIRGIANQIDFDELHWSPGMDKGAPTLTRDGIVVGGNGRAAAVRLAYDLPSGEAYAAPLRERLAEFGISRDAVRGMKKPMLVRIFEGDVDTRAAAVASNEGGTLRMSALEQAKVDGERLGKVGIVASDDGRLDVPENRGAIRRWVEQFPDAERAALLDADGRLSPEGVTRLRNAALHEAFGDSPTLARLIDSTDSALGRVSSALIRAAGKIAEVRSAAGRGELHGLDIGDDLLAAVEKFAWLREDGMPVDVFLQQTDLLGSGLSPEATEILAFLGRNSDSSVRMAEGIAGFYRGVEAAGSPSQGDLFGGGESVAPDRAGLLAASLAAVEGDRSTAAAKMDAVSPATRELAMEVSVGQLMDGRDIEVQALVDSDPAIGQASLEDVRAAADRADSLESIRTVDMDASRSVAEAVASGPKKWGAEEALAAGDAVMADLDLLAKNQDEAWKYARAYHGTPHIFPGDTRGELGGFRWDKMGTGEGAQAYGYGHYLAQDERISRQMYRDRLVEHRRRQAEQKATLLLLDEDALESFVETDVSYHTMDLVRQVARDLAAGMDKPDAMNKAFKSGGLEGNEERAAFREEINAMLRYNVLVTVGTKGDPAWKVGDRIVHNSMVGRGRLLANISHQLATTGYSQTRASYEMLLRVANDQLAKAERGFTPAEIDGKWTILDPSGQNVYSAGHGWFTKAEAEEAASDYNRGFRRRGIGSEKGLAEIRENIAEKEAALRALDELTVQDSFSPAWAEVSVSESAPISSLGEDFYKRLDAISPDLRTSVAALVSYRPDGPVKDIRASLENMLLDYAPSSKTMTDEAFRWGSEYVLEMHPPGMREKVLNSLKRGRPDTVDLKNFVSGVLQGAGIYIGKEARILRPDIKRVDPVAEQVGPGSVYTVEIPDEIEADFLQWDAPFDQQTAKVQDAFEAIAPGFVSAHVQDTFDGEEAYRTLARMLREDLDPEESLIDLDLLEKALVDLERRRGEDYAAGARAAIEHGDLQQSNAEEILSVMLSLQGVHGQKFLDGNSRDLRWNHPSARFNYVIFDDETASLVARYMRGEGPGQAQDVVERIAAESFGDATRALMDAGQISVVASTKELPGGPHPEDVRAMTAPDGRVYLVAQNLTAEDVPGLILHEVGAHVGLSRMLGPDGFEAVLADVDALLRSGSDEALAARAAVPSDTPSHLVREETLAYLLQNHPKHGIVRRVIAAVKAWLFENVEALRGVMRLTEEDLVSLAVSALRSVAREVDGGTGAGGVRYSRASSTIDPKAELAPYEQAVTKAKGYADAVRAAAARWGDDVAMRAAVEQASGGQLVGREIEELIDLLKVRHGEIVRGLRKVSMVAGAEDAAASLQDAALAAAEQMAENEVRAAAVERRNAALALAAKTRAISYVTTQFQGREIEGVKALLGGSQYLRPGARASVSVERQQFLGRWMAGLEGDLRRDGVWDMFVQDAYQDDVARALWQLSLEGGGSMDGIHPDAVKIAQSVHRYQQDVKLTLNRHGAWIGNLQGWMFRQGHDMDKMRAAGFQKWSDFATQNLDWPRIMDQLGVEDAAKFDRMEFLRAAWDDLSNGSHFKPESITEIRPKVGPGNLGKRESQSRTLHWKDADAGLSYLRQYGPGHGSLAEAILQSFSGSSRSAALMKVLGPNYEANLTAILDHVGDGLRGTPRGDAWRGNSKTVIDLLHHVDGSLSIPVSHIGAKVGGTLRAIESMAKLGAAVVTQVSDIPVYGAAIAHRFDTSIFHGIRDAISGLLQGRAKGDRMDILRECGYYYDSLIQQTFARFDADDVPGAMSKAMERFFKWGGITWWAETMRSSAVLTISRRMGDAHRTAHDALPKSVRDMLSLYRIDSGRWDLLRMAATREADGGTYLTPEGLRSVPDAAFENLLQQEGRVVSPAAVANLREDLASSYRSLLLDQSQYAALEPDERTRAVLLRGTQAGTWVGEIARCFAQFKSFPVVYAQRVFGREIYGRGYDSVGAYRKSGDIKAFSAMLGLMVALTVSGYAAATAKDLLKLRKPRPIDDPRTWFAAFMQGGALGIYGDFLFGSSNRLSGGLIPSLLGPVAGAVSQGYGLVADARTAAVAAAAGEDVDPTDLAARGLDFALQNTPFLNLHLLRPALNAAIIWRMQEALNPGYLERSHRRLKREMGTEYLFDPQQLAR